MGEPGVAQYWDAAEVTSLREGQGRTVEVNGRRLALFRIEGAFHAIDDACPHRGGSLGAGWVEGRQVFCPLHGWAFDPASGACSTRPDRPVRTYATKVEDGRVWIALGSD